MTKIARYWLALALFAAATGAFAGPVNINTADAETLSTELTGIGLVKAEAIVAYRKKNGPFRHADELLNVVGIGERTIEINRKNILTSDRPAGE